MIKHCYVKKDAKSQILNKTLILVSNSKLRFLNQWKIGSDNKRVYAYHQRFIDRTRLCNRMGVSDFKSVIQ